MDSGEKQTQVLEKLKNVDSQIDILTKLKVKLLSELKNVSAENSPDIVPQPQATS